MALNTLHSTRPWILLDPVVGSSRLKAFKDSVVVGVDGENDKHRTRLAVKQTRSYRRPTAGRQLGTLTLSIMLLGVAVLLLTRGPDELDQWKVERKAKGEKLSVKELGYAVSPEMAAAVRQLTGAVSRLRVVAPDPGGIELMRKLSPGYARVAWMEESLITDRNVTWRWDRLAAQMRTNEAVLGELRTLLHAPLRGPAFDMANMAGPSSTFLTAKRKCVQWLAGAEVDALHRGELDEALTNLHAIVSLARMNEEEWLLVGQMIRVAITGYGVSATWEALQAPGWDEARLVALQKDWEQVKLLPAFERTLEMERARGMYYFDYARTNRQGLDGFGLAMGFDSTNGLVQTFNRDVYLPVWQTTWSRRDELFFLKQSETIREAIRQANARGSYAEMRPILEASRRERETRRTGWNDFLYQLSDALLPNWEKALGTLMRQESLRQMAITAIALKRHELRHGSVPERLSALVPEFLSAFPRDYMTGKELLYERNADGSYVLYSAGENGRDEDALSDDIVWPLPGFPQRLTKRSPEHAHAELVFDDVPTMELVGKLAGQLNLALQFDPQPAKSLTNRVSVRLEETSTFAALEAILGNQGLVLTRGAKQRLNAVIADPYPVSYYYDNITDQPSTGEVVALVVLDGVPLLDAIRNLARHAQINFQFDPRVTERLHSEVTLRYENVSAEAVLKSVLRERGLVLLRDKKSKLVRVTLLQAE